MEPEVSLIGYKLLPGRSVVVKGREDTDNCIWTVHITQFALAADPKPGRSVVSVTKSDGSEFVLGTLVKDRCEQFTADFMIRENVRLAVSGASEVHLTGYLTTTELLMPDPDDDFPGVDAEEEAELRALEDAEDRLAGREFSEDEETMDTSDEEEEDVEESDEEEDEGAIEAPVKAQSPVKSAKRLAKLEVKRKPKTREILKLTHEGKLSSDDASEDEEEEESDDSEELDDYNEDALGEIGLKGNGAIYPGPFDPSDDDDAQDEPDPELPLKSKAGGKKRAAQPLPEKPSKRKTKAEPLTMDPKQPAQQTPGPSANSNADAAWEVAIKAYIDKEGPTALSRIGSVTKKPAGVSKKLKKIIQDSKLLALGADELVAARK